MGETRLALHTSSIGIIKFAQTVCFAALQRYYIAIMHQAASTVVDNEQMHYRLPLSQNALQIAASEPLTISPISHRKPTPKLVKKCRTAPINWHYHVHVP